MPSFIPTPSDDPVSERLLTAYFTSRALGFTTHPDGYRITHPDPAWFTPPAGVFLVVEDDDGRPVGCGGVRRIDDIDEATTYEIKHLWLDPETRGRGWSRPLMTELEQQARGFGAELMVLDTNESLTAAQHLYRSSGYEETTAYNLNKNATHWFRKRLD
ncbi:N-acetyltransferase [Nocardioides baekrokdamisoli]|uniref:N-acetyltransferase n=1 Tax=Nocardioides baekrokdamisoli TaxID=1804624 RepID=A0A3G9IHF2_9ACTN|nr:GNAT family N-acetyltransferase [Nocardioides baekrokdamisoli]BBH18457.1 N-acetyltransferase [Nocardioides baekrokdamisoli]